MNDSILRDGRGTGSRAKVDVDGRLHTRSLAIGQAAERAAVGAQYIIPVSVRAITSINTEHSILRINPTSATKRFHVHRMFVSVSGTTPVLMRLYRGSSIATANNVTFAPGNANTLSVASASMSCDVWNGVSTGMTIATKGTEGFSAYFAQGTTDVSIDGSQIWGLNAGMLVTAECAAANTFTAILSGWEEDI